MAQRRIRLVTFDALYTLITPRQPIHVQYSQEFAPYLGDLDPQAIKRSFKDAFRTIQREYPAYKNGSLVWWGEVIRQTALGAGANPSALEASLPRIVPSLMTRFSSKKGYKVYDDVTSALCELHDKGIVTAVVSNGDSRIRSALHDLRLPHLSEIVVSEEEGIEKPSPQIFWRVLERVNMEECSQSDRKNACIDYTGATGAGMNALLLQRGEERAHIEIEGQLSGMNIVHDLAMVVRWVGSY
ncbi:HAD hydrolase subfamily IA REG-2-like protein [Infundibulicybe gibba]|nr:HAD hydrolase subfamily IA REG-2-like protein [Infundibulicybe gibba]